MSSSNIFGWVPSTGASPFSISSFEETESRSARRGDPDWVARPRNAFIIFRCEYAKQNARSGGTDARRESSVDKTMSKRAGDAWKALSKREKDVYKKLAEREKVEHAIAHPGYRYRPKRRIASQRRHQRWNAQHSRLGSREESSDDDYGSSPVASPVQATPKALKRQSKSVPPLAPLALTPEMRRTKSDLEIVSVVPSSPNSPASKSYDLLYPSGIQYLTDHVSSLGIGSYTSSFSPASYQTSPLATVASSLAGWDGDVPMTMERISSTSSISSLPQQPQPSASSWTSYPSYHMPVYPESNVFWNPSQESTMSLNDLDSAFDSSAAIHNYHVGLSTQVQESTAADYDMIFDVPAVEEQRIFEGFVHF